MPPLGEIAGRIFHGNHRSPQEVDRGAALVLSPIAMLSPRYTEEALTRRRSSEMGLINLYDRNTRADTMHGLQQAWQYIGNSYTANGPDYLDPAHADRVQYTLDTIGAVLNPNNTVHGMDSLEVEQVREEVSNMIIQHPQMLVQLMARNRVFAAQIGQFVGAHAYPVDGIIHSSDSLERANPAAASRERARAQFIDAILHGGLIQRTQTYRSEQTPVAYEFYISDGARAFVQQLSNHATVFKGKSGAINTIYERNERNLESLQSIIDRNSREARRRTYQDQYGSRKKNSKYLSPDITFTPAEIDMLEGYDIRWVNPISGSHIGAPAQYEQIERRETFLDVLDAKLAVIAAKRPEAKDVLKRASEQMRAQAALAYHLNLHAAPPPFPVDVTERPQEIKRKLEESAPNQEYVNAQEEALLAASINSGVWDMSEPILQTDDDELIHIFTNAMGPLTEHSTSQNLIPSIPNTNGVGTTVLPAGASTQINIFDDSRWRPIGPSSQRQVFTNGENHGHAIQEVSTSIPGISLFLFREGRRTEIYLRARGEQVNDLVHIPPRMSIFGHSDETVGAGIPVTQGSQAA
jgi:hypothetical protein